MSHSARRCCLIAAISFGLAQFSAMAQVTAQRYELSIPEQSLAGALRTLGKTARTNIVFEPGAVQGRRAPLLEGSYSVDEALRRLLVGSGLTMEQTAGGSYSVRAVVSRPSVVPSQRAPLKHRTEGGVHTFDPMLVVHKADGFSATRMPTALKDIPQSVSIISQETLREQNATTVDEAFMWATGITVSRQGSTDSNFYSRGFLVGAMHVDGGGPVSMESSNPSGLDLSQYERIEVLRGADALFGGRGNPSASINLTRKRPLKELTASVALSTTSNDSRRLEADVGGSLSSSGRLRGRLVAARDDEKYFYDNALRKMSKLYGILEYDVTASTKLAVGATYEKTSRTPFTNGLPGVADGTGAGLSRSTGIVFPWAKVRSSGQDVFAQLDQAFGDRWRLRVDVARNLTSQEGISAGYNNSINPITRRISGNPTGYDFDSEVQQTTAGIVLNGGFDWSGRAQELVLGVDYSELKRPDSSFGISVDGPGYINPYDFDGRLYTLMPVSLDDVVVSDTFNKSRQIGIYGAAKLRPAERWTITLGARSNYYSNDSDGLIKLGSFVFSEYTEKYDDSGVPTPYAGIVYELNSRYSLYASYADVYNTNIVRDRTGKVLDPVVGNNMEVGLKGAWWGGRLNGSLAAFDIKQDNVSSPDPEFPYGTPGLPDNCCFIPARMTSKGVETELSGLLAPGWQISAGYTFNINRNYSGDAISSVSPKHLFKLWTNYQLPGAASNWSIGGGVLAQSLHYVDATVCSVFDAAGRCVGDFLPRRFSQGGYVVANLRLGYRLGERWNLALNVDNLFDRTYYQSIGVANRGGWYGEPRSWVLTLRGTL